MDELRLLPIPRRESEPNRSARDLWNEALPELLGSQADRQSREEAAALAQERDPELFFAGLLLLGGRQQSRGNFKVAAAIYERLGACPLPAIAEQARQRLSALTGQGSVGGRAEFLVSQFTRQATDYRTIVPMIAGSAVFHLTRTATLGRLAGSSAWFSRGFAARATAGLTGFAFEVPTFSLLSRGLMDLSGETVAWSGQAIAKDLAGSAITLGALKSFAFLGNQAYLKVHGLDEVLAATRLPAIGRFSRAAIPQAAAFTGLLLAHHVETAWGLRPESDGATAVTDTLAALVSLGVGGHLGKRMLGRGFTGWENELSLRAQIYSSPGLKEPTSQWAFALPQGPARLRPMAMSTPEDKGSSEPFFISTGRIRSATKTHETAMPFRALVHRNNLYGGRVLALGFQKPGQVYTLGAKNTVARQYKNLHESERGKRDATLVAHRDGYLHHRQRVEDLAERTPDFIDLFRNEGIRDKQATLEERNGRLFLRNVTRESLVWVLEGSKWRSVTQKEIPLQDGSWIVLGKDPANLPENTLDSKSHTVLRVELHRPKPLSPDRWNLIEFDTREPAQLEKIPTSEAYLGALLGQSPDFIAWRFRPLFKAMEEAGWKVPEAKDLLLRVFSDSPILAELNIGLLAEVLSAAQRSGWSHQQLSGLLFHEALAGKNGMTFLSRLPKLLEESAALKLSPAELSGLLARMAKPEGKFSSSLETLPAFLRDWQNSAGAKPPLQALFNFLDQAGVSIDVLRDLFPKIPGGEGVFLATMTRLIPALQKEYGYSGTTIAELSAELVKRMAEKSPQAPAKEWVDGALASLPTAFGQLFGHRFGFMEQRQILFGVAEEQGQNFSQWWRTVKPERGTFEAYLSAKPRDLPVAGLLTLGLGILGLHVLDAEVVRAFSPAFLLGASIFFGGAKGNRSMSSTFALPERLKAMFSRGAEKVERLLILGRRMENEGYFREARERYEAAVDVAVRNLDSLGLRGPDNRGRAGEAHRAVGTAFFDLAGFWDRRLAGRELMLDFYRTALEHLEPLGQKRLLDIFLIENAKARLQSLHLEEAEHWASMGDGHLAGKHYEAAGDFSTSSATRLELWAKASSAYAHADPPVLSDFGRVIQKIHEGYAK